jgi:hypothetical protein
VDLIPDRLPLRKSGSAGNRTRYSCVYSQELRPLDQKAADISCRMVMKGVDRGVFSEHMPQSNWCTSDNSARKTGRTKGLMTRGSILDSSEEFSTALRPALRSVHG